MKVLKEHVVFLYNEFNSDNKEILQEMFIYALVNILFGNNKYDFNEVIKMFLDKKEDNGERMKI